MATALARTPFRRSLLAPALWLLALLSGCATTVSGPLTDDDGTMRVSISTPRSFEVISAQDQALAEARYTCWSQGKSLDVLGRELDGATGALGLRKSATLRFACADTKRTS